MEALSSASAAFAVISLTFWKAIEDVLEEVTGVFTDPELPSAFPAKKQKMFAQHSLYDMVSKRIFSECHKSTGILLSKSLPASVAFVSSSFLISKWRVLKVTKSWIAVQRLQQDTISGQTISILPRLSSRETIQAVKCALSGKQKAIVMYAAQEFVLTLQYPENFRSMGRSKSWLLLYDLDISLLGLYQGKKGHDYCQSAFLKEATSPTDNFSNRSLLIDRRRLVAKNITLLSSTEWPHYLSVCVRICLPVTIEKGWIFTLKPSSAIPQDALIFDPCRQNNSAGVKILLGRGDASLECENYRGESLTSVYHGQIDVARFLIAAGAKNTADGEIWRNNVVLDARLKIARIKTLYVCFKNRNSIYGTTDRLSIFYSPSIRLDMTQEEVSDSILCVFKALTLSGCADNIAQFEYLRDMVSEGHEGKLIRWLISRVNNLHICHCYGSWGRYQP
ncbi:hypothetical protein EAE99_011691 [Botrytis elliptica]|nr:hypothetical protein EAE99_011691 [Botrytis elliptica]